MNQSKFSPIAVIAALVLTVMVSCRHGQDGQNVGTIDSINWVDSAATLCDRAFYYKNYQPDSLEIFVPEALKVCEEHNRMGEYYFIWGKLVSKYIWDNDFEKGAIEAQRMQDDALKRHNDYGLFMSYKLLGIGYGVRENYGESAKYLRKSIACFPKGQPLSDLIDAYSYLYLTLECDNQYEALDTVMNEWKAVLDKAPVVPGQQDTQARANWHASYQTNLARYLMIKEDFKGAALAVDSVEYYEHIENENPDAISQLTILIVRTDLAKHQKNWAEVLNLCSQRQKLVEEIGDTSHEMMVLLDRSQAFESLGRYRESLDIFRHYSEIKDSLALVDNREKLDELNKRFEVSELKMEGERQQMQAERRQLYLVIIIVLVILVAVIVIAYFHRRHTHRIAKMKAAQERIESELRIARDIQMSMVPSTFPDYEGLDMFASMMPAKEVGGDLYGYVMLDDKLYFAVGDVSGKGVPASLFMAQVTRLFRTLAAQQMMPAEICTRMNNALSGEDNESSMFVTLFLGLVDLKTGHLDFCNAGHNPPVLGGGATHGEFFDMIPNAPIGLWSGLEYEGEEIESIMGRPLFIYTDGLNEAENRQQVQFGESRLLNILRTTHFDSAKQVIEILKDEVERHRDGAEPNDDLTMMCLRIGCVE